MSFVLDASIALSWCFSDEASEFTDSLLERLQQETAFVPNIWSLKMSNILVGAERRKRISYASMMQFVTLLQQLDIQTDNENKAFQEVLMLAHSEQLTTCDAAYLELAIRKRLPLATKDKELCKAGERLGISIIKG